MKKELVLLTGVMVLLASVRVDFTSVTALSEVLRILSVRSNS